MSKESLIQQKGPGMKIMDLVSCQGYQNFTKGNWNPGKGIKTPLKVI